MIPRLLLSLALLTPLFGAAEETVDSQLFDTTTLVYSEDFDGALDADFWEIRQRSTWKVQDGILRGSQSAQEFQAQKIAAGDRAHAGLKPVIWLKQVPAEFVCTMRLRYNGTAFHPKYPLIDLGHHFHTIAFASAETTLTILKDQEVTTIPEPILSLGEWVEVQIELKKGTILFSMNGKTHRFDSELIDMGDQRQIDFKGLNRGTCEIDWIRVWAGK